MSEAKPISLNVRPSLVSHLCFEAGGILGALNAKLGDPVTAFDFRMFYSTLRSMPIVGDSSRLAYDSFRIGGLVKIALAALRAESTMPQLDSAINARQNAYRTKYGNISDIALKMQSLYTLGNPDSKFSRLTNLSQISESQKNQLQKAYSDDTRLGVVRQTEGRLNSTLDSRDRSDTSGRTVDVRASDMVPPDLLPTPLDDGQPNPSFGGFGGDLLENLELQEGSVGQTSNSQGHSFQQQLILNKDYAYRVPSLENLAQNERAQISLMDEMFDQFMLGLGLPFLEQTLTNELNSIDCDVYRLQIACLNTILFSPIAGTVTGVYKGLGDAVKAGEPVIRIENHDEILLVAMLKFKGPVSIGSNVTVNTMLFDSPGTVTTIAGIVVAARGEKEDDLWEVIVKCNNLVGGKTIFPIGYHFDYDNTTVDIS